MTPFTTADPIYYPRLEVRNWVVPGLNFSVKREQLVDGGRNGGEILELVHAKQHV